MKITITAKRENLTQGKEYFIMADYRKRHSKQVIIDNGLVLFDDKFNVQMIFSGFEITDESRGDTYIFEYSEVTL